MSLESTGINLRSPVSKSCTNLTPLPDATSKYTLPSAPGFAFLNFLIFVWL